MDKKNQNRIKSSSKLNQMMCYNNPYKFNSVFQDLGFTGFNHIQKNFFNDTDEIFSVGLGGDRFSSMFSEIQSFSGGNAPGTFISNSYVSTTKYDKNGKPHKEVFHSQSISQTDQNGKKLTEKQQAYKNSLSGLEKASHERKLDNKGHKIVKARNKVTGDQYEHNYYNEINEEDLNNFNKDYSDFKKNLGDVKKGRQNFLQAKNKEKREILQLPDKDYQFNNNNNVLKRRKKN